MTASKGRSRKTSSRKRIPIHKGALEEVAFSVAQLYSLVVAALIIYIFNFVVIPSFIIPYLRIKCPNYQ